MSNYIDCSCNGDNENCFRCYGSGRINLNELDPILPIKILQNPKLELEKNFNHETYVVTKDENGEIQKKILVQCKICANQIEKDIFKEHLITCKKNKIPLKKPIYNEKKEFWIKNRRGKLVCIVICNICNRRVNKENLKKHMLKVHFQVKHLNKSSLQVSSEQYDDVIQDRMNDDATKLYAHSYRENGRFGSHPEHDDHE
ncbi:hypothetical protein I6L24_16285 (plasmid) [Acinetobacter lwoffii]|jgi:hypothetical protein|uniref:hypothetical protein n=1 Tax=Acinetobacter lwoffii TaxID=28090 RepID=UPI001C22459F|nr:hypothetical protein [Acinetobacter lwoffii]QXB87682.1 hypothetical protein I6L24_16345 [Acinetobacter lwoffii]QXB87693.1 hypothetical protein I6L24_16285 [Acinetobacter lwoffii]